MSKKMYTVVSKDDPTKTVTCDWQNASELVFHGHWIWPSQKIAAEYHRKAASDAMKQPSPEGFPEDSVVAVDTDDLDDEDDGDAEIAPVIVAAPVVPTAAQPSLADLDYEELVEEAFKRNVKVDKRWGRVRLISEIENVAS